ncbi:hypothetical protein ACFOEQ_01285 [Chryseobacterium arachidis]|uniref:hypothetical protein n=1 Tax=Chryseobacterium arachidis TaxID=1416778 RepID=UPI00360F476D
MAKNPRKDLFPDFTSMMMKNMYGLFPKPIINTASAAMRLLMKVKNAPSDSGNVLEPSSEPHRIYGETILPVPSRKTKIALLTGLGLGLTYMFLKTRSSNSK